MKRILIIEDEAIAAQNLQRSIQELRPDHHIVAVLQSIEDAVEFFQQQPLPDLCFMDIHLADGLAFRIFDQVKVDCPIIFTTAYDQYALEAFKVNSIDYLLKPIDKEALQHALDKADRLFGRQNEAQMESLLSMFRQNQQHYQSSFLIPVADKLVPIQVSEILCFYLQDKITTLLTESGKSYCYEKPLDLVMDALDPRLFFRANRQYIIAHKAIREISLWPIGKLAVTLRQPTPERIIIPKARTADFKQWYSNN